MEHFVLCIVYCCSFCFVYLLVLSNVCSKTNVIWDVAVVDDHGGVQIERVPNDSATINNISTVAFIELRLKSI